SLAAYFHIDVSHPLAYVKWFTLFRTPHAYHGLFTLSQSTCMHVPHAEIISVSRIAWSCHLAPVFGRVKDP
ncbi:hypothetical protein BC835DRAFT_1290127, partial [Cytidiella melzeri]